MPVILAIQEAEIRRITVRSQQRQIVLGDSILKKTLCKKRTGRVIQSAGPEFKPWYHKKKGKERKGRGGEEEGRKTLYSGPVFCYAKNNILLPPK
jgi:hypothetical protein